MKKTFEDLEKFKAEYDGNPDDLILLRNGEIKIYPAEEAKNYHSVTMSVDQLKIWKENKNQLH